MRARTSSGSCCSEAAVKPTRSQKRTERMGKMNPTKNMTLWPFSYVSTPAESKQISQRRPSSPPHKYH